MVKSLIEAMLAVVIGLALYPVVDSATATALVNASGIALALLPLVPTMYIIVVIVGVVAYVYTAL